MAVFCYFVHIEISLVMGQGVTTTLTLTLDLERRLGPSPEPVGQGSKEEIANFLLLRMAHLQGWLAEGQNF